MSSGNVSTDSCRRPQPMKRPHSVGNRVTFVASNPRSTKSSSDAVNVSQLIAFNNIVVEDLDLNFDTARSSLSTTSVERSSSTSKQSPNVMNENFLIQLMEDVIMHRQENMDVGNLFGNNIPGSDFYVLVKRSTSFSFVEEIDIDSSRSNYEYNRFHQMFSIVEGEDDESTEEAPSSGTPGSSIFRSSPKYCWLQDDSMWQNENEVIWGETFIEPLINDVQIPFVPKSEDRAYVLLPNEVPDSTVIDSSKKEPEIIPSSVEMSSKTSSSRYTTNIPYLNTSSATNSSPKSHSSKNENQLTIEEIDLHLDYPLKYREVSLDNHGILITPTNAEAAGKLLVFESMENPSTIANEQTSNLGFFRNILRMLMNQCCCCTRNSNDTQRSKLRAKVCKTYFVKWEKPSTASQKANFTELRRCRSTTF